MILLPTCCCSLLLQYGVRVASVWIFNRQLHRISPTSEEEIGYLDIQFRFDF